VTVTEQQLDRAQVGAGFQQMDREGMAQGMGGDALRDVPSGRSSRRRVLIGWLDRSPGKSHTFGPSAFQ
jgi:hypothetical protein